VKGKKIVIGITGSIAAYKIPFLIRLFMKEGATVKVIMTPCATTFVTPLTLATLSRNPVIIDPFKDFSGEWNNHVELGSWADVMIFAPVTANTLGKMAHGIADNFLVTAYLSAKCPVFIAPAMDLDMYNHPTTKQNTEILRSFGNTIIEPQVGELASGLSGPGRLEEPEHIFQIIEKFFNSKNDLSGRKILVTAGPTYEKIDPVRYIGNFSSGKMGFALAGEAAKRGADVTLITGPTALNCDHSSIRRFDITSADELYQQCLLHFPKSDVLIMAAAVSDYKINHPSEQKLKKNSHLTSIELFSNVDILAELGKKKKKNQLLVGFALETENEIANARQKLRSKNLDLIIMNSLNDKGSGFGTSTNKVTMIGKSGQPVKGQLKDKELVAEDILDEIVKLL
jgi:phosphopantothenoylcysteine decarboxylase/phosphopantothenate--cysteine ligase